MTPPRVVLSRLAQKAEGESLKGQLALAADEADELRFRLTTAQSAADQLRDMQAELRSQLAQARPPSLHLRRARFESCFHVFALTRARTAGERGVRTAAAAAAADG